MLYFGDLLEPMFFFFSFENFCNLTREKGVKGGGTKGIFLGKKMGPSCHIVKEEQIKVPIFRE